MEKKLNHPFDEILVEAAKHIRAGADTHQKFSCAGCGARLSMEEPNTFYTHGTCDRCSAITDIRADGCNFMLVLPGRSPQRQLIIKESGEDILQ